MKVDFNISINNIKAKQIMFIAVSLIIVSINLLFLWIEQSILLFMLVVIVFSTLFIMNVLGSYLCKVYVLEGVIKIENLYRGNQQIELSKFDKIIVVFPYASLYKIYLTNGMRFYFAIDSKESFKTIFNLSHRDYAKKLTEEIKQIAYPNL